MFFLISLSRSAIKSAQFYGVNRVTRSKSTAAGGSANIKRSQQLSLQTNFNSNNNKKKQTLKAAVSVQPAIDKVQADDNNNNTCNTKWRQIWSWQFIWTRNSCTRS
ncbi:unnamed protein product [Didymodactylos carnosus]|uniref:Uncharacterized protein n=1 Tax=Didymodactylos carnosus TaxID=1234261 RepID=A0A816EYV9_9BILA|nr:unnamed protein product [Didymodactylos carnosus]CAF4593592.1 unnamed protein product [Didymodactylos carnosus]